MRLIFLLIKLIIKLKNCEKNTVQLQYRGFAWDIPASKYESKQFIIIGVFFG